MPFQRSTMPARVGTRRPRTCSTWTIWTSFWMSILGGPIAQITFLKTIYPYIAFMFSTVHLCLLALPHLEKTRGVILNISSMAGIRPFPPFLFYGCAKAAMDNWTKGFAQICSPRGVRINSLKFVASLPNSHPLISFQSRTY
jgi:hypothetical protein